MNSEENQNHRSDAAQDCFELLKNTKGFSPQELKRTPFVKAYKQLSSKARTELSEIASHGLVAKHQAQEPIYQFVLLLISGFAVERDWQSADQFLESLLSLTFDRELYIGLATEIKSILDNFLDEPSEKVPVVETSLVILTQFSLKLANHHGKSSLDHRGAKSVVEAISSELVAKANTNSNALRIAIIQFLNSNQLVRSRTSLLDRNLDRYGQSLLDNLFRAFFEDKKRSTAAFYYLVEHLNAFYSRNFKRTTDQLLKQQMLKFPDEFPRFLKSYSEWVSKDSESLLSATEMLGKLLHASVLSTNKILFDDIGRVIMNHLTLFSDHSAELLQSQVNSVAFYLYGQGGNEKSVRRDKKERADEYLKQCAEKFGLAPATSNRLASLSRVKRGRKSSVKMAKLGEKPNPLESMILLAS